MKESDSEIIKEGPSLVFRNKIIDSDELLTKEGLWLYFWWHKGRKILWKSEGYPVGASGGEALILIDSTLLGVADSYKLGEELVFKVDASLAVFS